MLKRAWFRIQPIEQIRKRKRRKKEMWERHNEFVDFVEKEQAKPVNDYVRTGRRRSSRKHLQEGAALEQADGDGITTKKTVFY